MGSLRVWKNKRPYRFHTIFHLTVENTWKSWCSHWVISRACVWTTGDSCDNVIQTILGQNQLYRQCANFRTSKTSKISPGRFLPENSWSIDMRTMQIWHEASKQYVSKFWQCTRNLQFVLRVFWLPECCFLKLKYLSGPEPWCIQAHCQTHVFFFIIFRRNWKQ